jgi:hypothetical protein
LTTKAPRAPRKALILWIPGSEEEIKKAAEISEPDFAFGFL